MKGVAVYAAVRAILKFLDEFGSEGLQWVLIGVIALVIIAIVAIAPVAISKYLLDKDEDECKNIYAISCLVLLPIMAFGIWKTPEIHPGYGEKNKAVLNIDSKYMDQYGNEVSIEEESQVNDVYEEELPKKYKSCPLCFGNRRCGGCGGSGMVYNAIDYSPGQYVECSACDGSGLCGLCEGTGMIEDLGWSLLN